MHRTQTKLRLDTWHPWSTGPEQTSELIRVGCLWCCTKSVHSEAAWPPKAAYKCSGNFWVSLVPFFKNLRALSSRATLRWYGSCKEMNTSEKNPITRRLLASSSTRSLDPHSYNLNKSPRGSDSCDFLFLLQPLKTRALKKKKKNAVCLLYLDGQWPGMECLSHPLQRVR